MSSLLRLWLGWPQPLHVVNSVRASDWRPVFSDWSVSVCGVFLCVCLVCVSACLSVSASGSCGSDKIRVGAFPQSPVCGHNGHRPPPSWSNSKLWMALCLMLMVGWCSCQSPAGLQDSLSLDGWRRAMFKGFQRFASILPDRILLACPVSIKSLYRERHQKLNFL